MKPEGYHTVRTHYVRIIAAALKFLAVQLAPYYADRWRMTLEGNPRDGFNIRFTHWGEDGLEASEHFGVSEERK